MPDDSRRFLLVLCTGLLLFAGVLVAAVRGGAGAGADDSPLLETVATLPSSTTTPTTASLADAAPPPTTARPVDVPADPYAAEPIQEIGTIEIPKIGLRHRMFHGITLRNIDKGPSHWPGTALPGEVGNVVVAGHRVTHSRPFRNIHELVPGDLVHFEVNGVRTTYAVTGSEIVPPTALWITDPTPTPTATLFACHPPGSARQRYVVRLALVADPPAPAN